MRLGVGTMLISKQKAFLLPIFISIRLLMNHSAQTSHSMGITCAPGPEVHLTATGRASLLQPHVAVTIASGPGRVEYWSGTWVEPGQNQLCLFWNTSLSAERSRDGLQLLTQKQQLLGKGVLSGVPRKTKDYEFLFLILMSSPFV